MFTAALFTIAKTWKHPKCLSTDEWIKQNVVCIHTMEYKSVIKRNGVLILSTTWINLKNMRLGEDLRHESYLFNNSIYMKCQDWVNPQRQND